MMHYEDIVAVLCDSNKKPLRESESQKLDNGRKAKIFLPFESEYQFLIKNNSDKRIIIRIDIDGANVSGNGLIMNAHESDYIERFVDAAKKFKFVKATSEGVSDPTNKENGVIKVRVRKERKVDPKVVEHHHHHHDNWWIGGYPYRPTLYDGIYTSQHAVYGSSVQNSDGFNSSVLRGVSSKGLSKGLSDSAPASLMSFCCSNTNVPAADVGATVEGGKSDQSFGLTTWNGDEDIETVFTFHLSGTLDIEKERKMQEYLKLKAELGL